MKFPTMEEFAKNVAEKALDEYKYNGKTLREWIEIIASNDGDTISRKAAIEAVGKLCDGCDNGGWCGECRIDYPDKDAIDVLEALPPAEPKRGKWIKLDMHRGMADHKCTACEQECYVPTCMGEPMYAYCPNCGAKMEGEQDG